MANAMGGMFLAATDRCRTCDGLDNRIGIVQDLKVPTRPCPECGQDTRRCDACDTWLASNWFGGPYSTTCSLCYHQRRRQRPWSEPDAQRLLAACEKLVSIVTTHPLPWTIDDNEAWHDLLSEMGHTPLDPVRLYKASQVVLDIWPRYFDEWQEADLVLWRALLAAMERGQETATGKASYDRV